MENSERQIVESVVKENFNDLPKTTREPYEDNYDGFTHYTKSGLVDEVLEVLEEEGLKVTKSNAEDVFFEVV